MRFFIVLVLLVGVGCGGCDNGNNAQPNNTNNDTPDVSTETETDDGPIVAKRQLQRQVPFQAPNVNNLLEDPNFGFQNESWFVVDGAGNNIFARRIYETVSPEQRPIAGLLPTATNRACMVGRLKWADAVHEASVWLATDSGNFDVDITLIGLRTSTPAEWVGVQLLAGETQTIGDRNWTKYETSTPGFFGWGFFEICNNSDEVLFAGAPLVIDTALANAVRVFPNRFIPISDEHMKRIARPFRQARDRNRSLRAEPSDQR